jgi:hypothetical protein
MPPRAILQSLGESRDRRDSNMDADLARYADNQSICPGPTSVEN